MTRKSADMIGYEEITLLGTPALLTFERLFRDSVPEGMFLYELRHADEMWGGPCQLAEKILVNFYGSILTTDPIQLPVDGYLDFNKGDLVNTGGYYQKIQNFRKKYPSAGRDIMRFSVLKPEEYPFLYSHETECDQACQCIGHVRGDFDMNKVLHTTWWPHHQDDVLNTPRFKADLQRVVEWLRKGFAPLRDLETMGRFCSLYENMAKLPGDVEKVYGFRVDTKNYMYALRCTPEEGAYHVYLYCYGKEDKKMFEQVGTKYIDARGWKYKVMGGIGSDCFKARYQKPDRDDPVSGWKCVAAVPWRGTFAEAQADLDRLAKERGWEVWNG